jgi:hypothetical protein
MLIAATALELAVAVVAALAARKARPYLYGLSFTFAVFALYDLGRLLGWDVEQGALSVLFLFAIVGALFAVWKLYQESA